MAAVALSALDPSVPPTNAQPKSKANRNRSKQTQAEQGRTDLIVIRDSAPLLDHVHSPEVQSNRVQQSTTRDDGKRPGCRKRKAVAEVEERGGDGAEEDAELEPGEEGAFCGELNLGLDADRDMDAFLILVISHVMVLNVLTLALRSLEVFDLARLLPAGNSKLETTFADICRSRSWHNSD